MSDLSCFLLVHIFQAAEIDRRIAQETKAEQHIHKLLLLGMLKHNMLCIYQLS